MRSLFVFIVAATMVACGSNPSVTEFQCRAGDWETVGYRDGSAGMRSTQLLSHQEACGQYGIVPHREQYLTGWNAGVAEYCTAANGFSLGERGGRLNAVCQGELEYPFAAAFAEGRALYLARRAVDRAERQLDSHHNRLQQIKRELVELTTAQLDPALTTDERVHLIADMTALHDEREEIKLAIPQLEQELRFRQAELDQLH